MSRAKNLANLIGGASAGTSGMALPSGTTAQRPSSPATGTMRYNSTRLSLEYWDPTYSQWVAVDKITTVEVLVIAGGASGTVSGHGGSPGGGAGGYIEHPALAVVPGISYTITVGAGGAAVGAGSGAYGSNNGSNSTFGTLLTAIGGGGANKNAGNTFIASGRDGGSGGGVPNSTGAGLGIQPSQAGDSGVYGFGNNGGTISSGDRGGGGGGAGSAAPGGTNSNGGAGKLSSITGVSTVYAGGGAGGAYGSGLSAGAGGSAIGGDGVPFGGASGATGGSGTRHGATNTGSGGGGAWSEQGSGSGSGGSGVIIVASPNSISSISAGLTYTLDTVTRPGFKIYKFTAGTGTISW